MKDPEDGGSRIGIVFNGSPLFTGGPNSGESAIRRWIIENDWLEAIVGLPENLFYNTGIHTYIWVVSNQKPESRKGKVQLINARDQYKEMKKNLGEKSHKLTPENIEKVTSLFGNLSSNGRSKIVPNEELGYRRIIIDRPLRQRFQAKPDRIEDLDEERAFKNREKKKQEKIKEALTNLPSDRVWMDREEFRESLNNVFSKNQIDVSDSVVGNIENVLGESDPEAEICRNNKGEPEYDLNLRNKERVPLTEDPYEYFEREVEPYVQNAWINEESKRFDGKDGELGIVGYEINFNKFFYEYQPPRELDEIDRDIRKLEEEIDKTLQEVMN